MTGTVTGRWPPRRAQRPPPPRGQVVLAVLVGLAALLPVVVGAGFIASDLRAAGEKFDGLGLMIGVAMLAPVAVAAVAVAAWWWRWRGGRAGWIALGVAAVVVGAEVLWVMTVLGLG